MLYVIQFTVLLMHVFITVDFEMHMAANLLTETLMLRDHVFYFPNGFSMSYDELNEIINYICLS